MEKWKILKELYKKAGGCRWKFIDDIIPKQNISPLKEGDVPLWQD
jgi:hypothetical protein